MASLSRNVERLITRYQDATGVPLVYQWSTMMQGGVLKCSECKLQHDLPNSASSGEMLRFVRDVFMTHKRCSAELHPEGVEDVLDDPSPRYNLDEQPYVEPVRGAIGGLAIGLKLPAPIEKPVTMSPFTQIKKRRITL